MTGLGCHDGLRIRGYRHMVSMALDAKAAVVGR